MLHENLFSYGPATDIIRLEKPDIGELEESTRRWAETELKAQIGPRIFTFSGIRVRPWSRIFSIHTDRGERFYLKLPSGVFHNEASITKIVALYFPSYCVEPLIDDSESGALLLPDMGVKTAREVLRAEFNRELPYEIVMTYARMQAGPRALTLALAQAGVPNWEPRGLIAELDRVLSGQRYLEFSKMDYNQIVAKRSALSGMCCALTESGINPTFDHGDFQDNNILMGSSSWRIIDWADLCVTHPFFSLATFCHSLRLAHKTSPTVGNCVDMIVKGYLKVWGIDRMPPGAMNLLEVTHRLYPILCILKLDRLFQLNQRIVDHYASSLIDYWLRELLALSDAAK